jgi:hypothetical protein
VNDLIAGGCVLDKVVEAVEAMQGRIDPDDIVKIGKRPNDTFVCTIGWGTPTDRYLAGQGLSALRHGNVVFALEEASRSNPGATC